MKYFKMKMIAMLISSISLQVFGGTGGHGGDPLRQLFEDARGYAAERIQKAKPCAFNVDVRPEVVLWIMNHQAEFAADIQNSPHTWVTEPQSTCAFTQIQRNFPITFSFDACRLSIKEANDAIFILALESSHHLGVVDETFADEVGRAIERLGQNCTCNPTPSVDPFDPNSCPGRQVSSSELYSWIPLPKATSKELGPFKAFIRQRTCYASNLCTDWQDAPTELQSVYGYPTDPHFQPQVTTGKIVLELKNNGPEVAVASDGSPGSSARWDMTGNVNEFQKFNITYAKAAPEKLSLRFDSIEDDLSQLKGWITPTCLREAVAKASAEKDSSGNDIIVQTEMVILSTFN